MTPADLLHVTSTLEWLARTRRDGLELWTALVLDCREDDDHTPVIYAATPRPRRG